MSVRGDRLAALVRIGSMVVDRVAPPKAGLTILIYHRVGATTDVAVDLPIGAFRAQMEFLASTGRVTTLTEGLRADPATAPVVISFDDGTADWVELAMPVLYDLHLPATFYVSTMFVEEQRMFPDHGRPVAWSGLQEMVSTGLASIGSHTHTHHVLANCRASLAAGELDHSRSLIEDHLGVTCEDFAYPKAILGSPAAEIVVRRTFATASLAGSRSNSATTDHHRLWRTPITVRDDAAAFMRKVNGGMRLEGQLRNARDRLRHRTTLEY